MLKLDNISLSYEKMLVIDSLSYEFEDKKKTLIMGASGIGKTSLLNIIASTLKPSSGRLQNSHKKISYVFQEPRLFEWLTALENVSIVSNKEKAKDLLTLMGLEDSFDKYPSELSGGMKQRVSIARALAYEPDLILLDEPFKGLDDAIKNNTIDVVLRELRGKTAILISHDKDELSLASDIYLMQASPVSSLTKVKSGIPFTE